MIEVMRDDDADHALDWRAALAAGKAVQFYSMDHRELKGWVNAQYPEADIWYTERNGDPIGMLVPKGTPREELPDWALGYIVFEWIDPDGEFNRRGRENGIRKR